MHIIQQLQQPQQIHTQQQFRILQPQQFITNLIAELTDLEKQQLSAMSVQQQGQWFMHLYQLFLQQYNS